MTTNRVDTLRRIAGANHRVESGEGLKPDHFVPVCSIRSRELAATLRKQLEQKEIEVKIHRERLCTRFFVTHQNLSTALQIHEALLAKHPDDPARKFSRDYDSVLLLAPPTVLMLVTIVLAKPQNNVWVGILSISITAIVVLERLNRLYRNNRGAKWGIIDLIGITLAVAVNVAVWRFMV